MEYESPIDTLKSCNGYYESPRDETGKILGPLVAYTGKYKTADGQEKQWVGPEYFNFAQVEQNPAFRDYFAQILVSCAFEYFHRPPDLIIGMPMGGILLASDIGRRLGSRTIFAEKKIVALADSAKGLKETSELIIERHEIRSGDRVGIVDDVCNNFSTTEKAIDLIKRAGAQFLCIFCAIDRSVETKGLSKYPVLSTMRRPSEQYRQDDPIVADLIAEGKIIWKPKQQWEALKAAMGE